MSYIVYENRVLSKAIVHRTDCSYVKMNGGVSKTSPPSSWWLEGFETADAALKEAQSTGRRDVRTCSYCKP